MGDDDEKKADRACGGHTIAIDPQRTMWMNFSFVLETMIAKGGFLRTGRDFVADIFHCSTVTVHFVVGVLLRQKLSPNTDCFIIVNLRSSSHFFRS
jgi:hypothetical protein